MATIKTSQTIIASLGNPIVKGYKLTAVNSATIVNNDMYVLKSCGATADNILYPICFYKVEAFATKPKATLIKIKDTNGKEIEGIARHANAITFAKNPSNSSGLLYVATMNVADQPQVLEISLAGVLKKKIKYMKNGVASTLNCLNYVGVSNGFKKFIVGTNKINGRYNYDFALLKGSILEYTGVSFVGTNANKDWTSNDITYSGSKLYHTFFKTNDSGVITYNKIFVYKIPSGISGSNNVLNPCDIIESNRTAKFDKKYEIEAFVIYKSNWYVACNCNSTNKNFNKDHILKLTKK